jgi:FkbM family methyltransferase
LRGHLRGLLIRMLRIYVARSPLPRGKGLITRQFLIPLLPPPPPSFIAKIPGGGKITLHSAEAIGFAQLTYGSFEKTELGVLCALLFPGAVVIDVGANIGYFSVALGLTVGQSGRVIACEPEAENVRRLAENVALNNLTNVEIHQIAIGDHDGKATLFLADDSVYHTTAIDDEQLPIMTAHATGQRVTVGLARLDTVWRQCGSPDVASLKIDVEGGELNVLRGSKQLIGACRPSIMIETLPFRLTEVKKVLAELGYSHRRPKGFNAANHLFTPD